LALIVPSFTYEQIRAKAEEVLDKYHPERTLPVPVEEILEFQCGITIIPMPGLKQVHEIDAFTGKGQSSIFIDQGVFEQKSPFRYRFSLAHELGHIELHREVQAQIEFSTVDEWKTALRKFPEHQRSTLEFQAYDFAGLLLVPREALKAELEQYIKILNRAKFDLKNAAYTAKPYVCTKISKSFAVSDQVIDRRLDKEKLWPP